MLGLVAYASRRPTNKKKLFWSIAPLLILALTAVEIWYQGPVLREAKVHWYAMRLKSDDPKVHASAARALGEMGPKYKSAVSALIEALKTSQSTSAAYALGEMGPKAKSAVPALREMLKSNRPRVRDDAARALRKIGADPRFVPDWSDVPRLIDELFDLRLSGDALRLLVVSGSLQEFRSESDLQSIRETLDHSESRTRMAAAWALGKIGIQSKPAVPKLLDLLRDEDQLVGVEAAQALKKIEPEAFQKVIPSLIT
ncbi:MAG: HEAT repeat domain-containing protein, partial [Planctomycetes bacterium]|nr:HEAT repeat domain-containing protein [Planctomycetota bacterium]